MTAASVFVHFRVFSGRKKFSKQFVQTKMSKLQVNFSRQLFVERSLQDSPCDKPTELINKSLSSKG